MRKRTRSNQNYTLSKQADEWKSKEDKDKHLVETIQDITQRKQVSEEIENIAEFSEENPHPILRIASDGVIVYANPSSKALLKYWNCEIGQIIPEPLRQLIADVFRTKVTKKDIEIKCDKQTFSFTIVPVSNSSYNNLYGVDVTNCRLAEAALRKSEAALVEAQNIAHIGNWEWDIEKDITYQSAEVYRILGLVPEECRAAHNSFLQCIHPDDREYVRRSVRFALQNKKPFDIEFRMLLKDETVRTVHERAVVIYDESGRPVRMVGTIQDLTGWKKTEEEINLLQTITALIPDAEDFHSALGIILHKVCEITDWVYGEAWVPSLDENNLECKSVYYGNNDYLKKFWEKSRDFIFMPGVGLPGRVWSSKKPEWKFDTTINRVGDFPRASITEEFGLKSGMGIPVIAHDKVIAVLCFFVCIHREEDERLIRLISSVANQLGAIIKQKQIEAALYESEKKLQSILDNTEAIIHVKDIQGRYTFINRQFEKLYSLKRNAIMGKTDYDLFPKEIADAYRLNDSKVIENKMPMKFDEILYHSDGPHIYISIKFPLFDSNRKVCALCDISTDITDRKLMESEILTTKGRLEYLLKVSPAMIYSATYNDYRVTFMSENVKSQLGYEPQEFIEDQKFWFDHIHPEDLPDIISKLSCLGKVNSISCEYRFLHKNGIYRIVYDELYLVYDESGNPKEIIGCRVDITERRHAEEEKLRLREQLYHSQRLESIGKLAGGIAHDFSNIMAIIMGYGDLLQAEMGINDLSRVYAEKILAAAGRATSLVQGLLAFSRRQANDPKPEYLNEIVKRAKAFLVRLIGEDIVFDTILTNKDCTVMVDSGQMEQVLMNLVTNARDAMPQGGSLVISTDVVELGTEFINEHGYGEVGPYALVSVSDTGIGLDGEAKRKIFEPFFTTKEIGKGTGLGLSVVYGIIKQHQGYITVESEYGKGTTFRIYLPITGLAAEEREPGVFSTSEEGAKIISMGRKETILLAEDEAEVREITKVMLEKADYKVIEAVDGDDAIHKFIEHKDEIRLLIMDIIMPNKKGTEAYDTIKKISPDVKVLFMSGYSSDIIMRRNIAKEFLSFISKPVLPEELLKRVGEVIVS